MVDALTGKHAPSVFDALCASPRRGTQAAKNLRHALIALCASGDVVPADCGHRFARNCCIDASGLLKCRGRMMLGSFSARERHRGFEPRVLMQPDGVGRHECAG